VLQRRVDADHLSVRLALHQARKAVHPVAPDAHAAVCCVADGVLREVDPDGQVERVQPLLLQIVAQLLDPRLVLHWRERVLGAGPALGGVLAVPTVHQVELLGLRVVRLEVGVSDRPGRRYAVVVPQLTEVLGSQPEQRRAVELRVAADVVVHLGRELVAVLVVPELRSAVLALHEHGAGLPVVPLAGQVVAAFEQQNPLPVRREPVGQRAAAGPAADDDHVIVLVVDHARPPSRRLRAHAPASPRTSVRRSSAAQLLPYG
jgi:hypothetical protein